MATTTVMPYAAGPDATLDVRYPDRQLDRWSSALRPVFLIPIAIVLAAISGWSGTWGDTEGTTTTVAIGGTGLLVLPPLLLLVFRRKYPRWWFDFNREFIRFAARVGAYATLLTDRYPSTD